MRSKEYREFLREHGRCRVCETHGFIFGCKITMAMNGVCDPAHTENNGMSSKGPDSSCAPLCRNHHDQYDGHRKLPNGEVGREAFEAYYKIDMKREAAMWYAAYQIVKANV